MMIHLLTILFAFINFTMIFKKRYREVPFIFVIMLVAFIGFGFISILLLVSPYGILFSYPCGAIVLGVLSILLGINDLSHIIFCTKKIEGIYCGYHTYYGNNGISTRTPVFEYVYQGIVYHEQTTQNLSYKQVTQTLMEGNRYMIYVNPRYPNIYVYSKKIKVSMILLIILGVLFLIAGSIELIMLFLRF